MVVLVRADTNNTSGAARLYVRLSVKMEVNKLLKRGMKIKRVGYELLNRGARSWVNFKCERLNTFYLTCGHSKSDCVVVYANPDKLI